MRETTLKVLMVQDREDDALLLSSELRKGGYHPDWKRVETKEAMNESLAGERWDLVLSACELARFKALDALQTLQESGQDLPFIVIADAAGEGVIAEVFRAGAHDFLTRGKLARLLPAVRRELREAQERSERRRAEDAVRVMLQTLQAIHEASPLAIVAVDPDSLVTAWNPAATELFGWSAVQVMGKPCPVEVPGIAGFFQALAAAVMKGKRFAGAEMSLKHRSGSLLSVEVSSAPMKDARGGVTGAIFMMGDVTVRKDAEAMVDHISRHDILTGLPNRFAFKQSLIEAIDHAKERQGQVAVAFADLDGFKAANDSLGQAHGDLLLSMVARRLVDLAGEEVVVARLGGDEFGVLLEDVASLRAAAQTAARLVGDFTRPFTIDERDVAATLSVGMAVYPGDAKTADDLLRCAERAQLRVRTRGGNAVEFYGNRGHEG